MNYFECKKRLLELRVFHGLAARYFTNVVGAKGSMETGPFEDTDARNLRSAMNKMMKSVSESFDKVNIPRAVHYIPPRLLGGPIMDIDLVWNVFDLWRYKLSPRLLDDVLNRAIGAFEEEKRRLFCQFFNPFYWLNIVLGIPFRLLTAVGLDGTRYEESVFGKLVKVCLAVVGFVAAILDIQDHPVFVARVSSLFHRLIHWR